jgi:hypothetical protein
VDLQANLLTYLDGNIANPDGRDPTKRYASFDHCFNYFQLFRESGNVPELAVPANMQLSCLHLGFYLASWGMLRNSELMERSAKYLVPVVEVIATSDPSLWGIDVDSYTESNIRLLVKLAGKICDALPDLSCTDTLKTKIILGVFGSVPGFDRFVSRAFVAEDMVGTFNENALRAIAKFYNDHDKVIMRTGCGRSTFAGGIPSGATLARR